MTSKRFIHTLIALLALVDLLGTAQLWIWWQERRGSDGAVAARVDSDAPAHRMTSPTTSPGSLQRR